MNYSENKGKGIFKTALLNYFTTFYYDYDYFTLEVIYVCCS